ncbi:hypothetical protein GYMLUDRAFT_32972 [Collybiopsis luxurians FD-317 M1]|nr:hypothetical protein GYMLUDRAFT_32972 [Collybiopsis luxurians FD-317 M1]
MSSSKRKERPDDSSSRESDNEQLSEQLSAGSDDSADDIEGMKPQKSRQTKKRKIRATHASAFGATLQSLLNTEAPSSVPLSLKPSIARKRNDEKLEIRAKKVLQVERKEKEDRGRITDVIGGWGGESERALRKVAQRGVVKLFNLVQQAQNQAAVDEEEKKAARGSGKPSLPAPMIVDDSKSSKKGKKKDNILGRGKEGAMDKDDFFEMIRSGAVVSKA